MIGKTWYSQFQVTRLARFCHKRPAREYLYACMMNGLADKWLLRVIKPINLKISSKLYMLIYAGKLIKSYHTAGLSSRWPIRLPVYMAAYPLMCIHPGFMILSFINLSKFKYETRVNLRVFNI